MPDLSSNNLQILLELARNAIRHHLETGSALAFETDDRELNLLRGCFITLRKQGHLRGCVGTFDATQPLYRNVIRMAPAAAFQDIRFPPVTKQEFGQIRIEVSVLGKLVKVDSFEEIQVGRDGVYVKLGDRSGTYLPEVAVEQKWNTLEFVTFCAREKAGLTPEDCQRADVFRYEVEKVKEA